MQRKFPWICGMCLERRVVSNIVERYECHASHDGKSHSFIVPNLEIPTCEACGEGVITTFAADRVDAAFRQHLGLMSPAEIRSGRETLGLTQKELAERLHLSESTISRWENGHQMQQASMDLLLRIAFEPQAAIRLLERSPSPVESLEQSTETVPQHARQLRAIMFD